MESSPAEAPPGLKVAFPVKTTAADEGTVLTVRPIAAFGLAPEEKSSKRKQGKGARDYLYLEWLVLGCCLQKHRSTSLDPAKPLMFVCPS